jgi:hypothetical protein
MENNKVYGLFKGKSYLLATNVVSLRMSRQVAYETEKAYNDAAKRNPLMDKDRYFVKVYDVR